MNVSLVQVSKVAGVSKSTVSRILNQDPRVSPEAVRAVTEAIAQLGYSRPHRMGRPRRSTSGLVKSSVSLLFPDTNPQAIKTVLSGRILHGVEEVLRRKGVSLVVSGLPEAGRLPQAIEQRQVDGLLIRGTATDASRKTLVEKIGRLPCVMIFAPRGPIPDHWDVALEDNDAIAAIAFDYLRSKGRRQIGFLNCQPDHPSFSQRARGFAQRVADGGCTLRAVASESRSPAELVDELLSGDGPRIDGLFVPGADDAVVAVYRALVGRGLTVGRDIDLICCFNDPVRLATLSPSLANIDIHAEAIGRAAAETLLWRLQHPREPQRRLTVAPALVDPAVEVGAAVNAPPLGAIR